MALELWIPGKRVEYRCFCGAEFSDKEKGMRHAVGCAKRHADEIAEAAERRDASALGGALDKEKSRWAQRRQRDGKRAFNGRGDVA